MRKRIDSYPGKSSLLFRGRLVKFKRLLEVSKFALSVLVQASRHDHHDRVDEYSLKILPHEAHFKSLEICHK